MRSSAPTSSQGINPAQQRQIDHIKQASDAEITFEKVARNGCKPKTGKTSPRTGAWTCWNAWCLAGSARCPSVPSHPPTCWASCSTRSSAAPPTVAGRSPPNHVSCSSVGVATLRAGHDPVWPVSQGLARQQDAAQDGPHPLPQIGKLLNDFDNHRCTRSTNCMQLMWWT